MRTVPAVPSAGSALQQVDRGARVVGVRRAPAERAARLVVVPRERVPAALEAERRGQQHGRGRLVRAALGVDDHDRLGAVERPAHGGRRDPATALARGPGRARCPPNVSRRTPARQPCSAGPPDAAGCRAARRSSSVGSVCAGRRRRGRRAWRAVERAGRSTSAGAGSAGGREETPRGRGGTARGGRSSAGRLGQGHRRGRRCGAAPGRPAEAQGAGRGRRTGARRTGARRTGRSSDRRARRPDPFRASGLLVQRAGRLVDHAVGVDQQRPHAVGVAHLHGHGPSDRSRQLRDPARDGGTGLGEVRHAHALDDAVDRDLPGAVVAHLGADLGQSGRRRRRLLPVGSVTHGVLPLAPDRFRPRNYAAQPLRALSRRRPALCARHREARPRPREQGPGVRA